MKEVQACRICGNRELIPILDLGNQALTGKFPASRSESVATMPLELVKCSEASGRDACGLVQLRHTGDLSDMYGEGYGYRSGLNKSMVLHLQAKVKKILARVPLSNGDLVIDIGITKHASAVLSIRGRHSRRDRSFRTELQNILSAPYPPDS